MSITSGFYNSIKQSGGKGDRLYDAVQMSDIFEGLITTGVFSSVGHRFLVTAAGGTSVNVASGKAWLHKKWIENDADYVIDLGPAEAVQNRYDAIILEVDNTAPKREARIFVKKGTASSVPEKPAPIKTKDISQMVLAYVFREANKNLIENNDIDYRVGTSDAPFVTGEIGTKIRSGYAPPDNSIGIDGDVYIQIV